MAFQNNDDLESMLPTTNPNAPGAFSGNQNMNIDQSASRSSTVAPPPRASNRGNNRRYRGRLPEEGNNQTTNQAATNTGGTYGVPAEQEELVEPRINPITGRRKAAIIKSHNLCYEGQNFEDFLNRFELAADLYGAEGYDKVRQICFFVGPEELKQELESMDGYKERDWATLRASMMEIWGDTNSIIRHTIKDLYNLAEESARAGGPKGVKEFLKFKAKFMLITKYLITNEHIRDQQDVTHIFFQGFPREMQRAIKHEMVKSDLIPYGKDGHPKTPHLEDLMDTAQDEVRAAADETFFGTGFGEANRFMQKKLDEKKGDGKRREKMIEESPPEALQKQVETLSKAIESLASKVDNQGKGEYSRGNDRPTGKLYEPKPPCHYCHREGHSAGYCQEAQKDEREGLVTRDGKFFSLPNGQRIPWDPSRPIRSVVATESAKPKPQINMVYQTNHPSVFEIKEDAQNHSNVSSSVHRIDWEPPRLGATNFEKIRMEANAAKTRAEALRGRRNQPVENQETPMDVDQEDPPEELIEDIPAVRKTPGRILEAPGKKNKSKESVESALVNELDSLKIPTTFSQLTAISPSYVQELIEKLQQKLPGNQSSKISYIKGEEKGSKVSASMVMNQEEEDKDFNCYYSCALGFIDTRIRGQKVPFMVDSGAMVNVIPRKIAIDLDLEVVEVDIPMRGIGGERCDIKGIVESCDISIGRFTGPVHLFVSPQAQECILGRPFLFDYDCTLDYPGTGELLSFQGDSGRRITVPIAKIGQGKGWYQLKDLNSNSCKISSQQQDQHFL